LALRVAAEIADSFEGSGVDFDFDFPPVSTAYPPSFGTTS
jgi:hypothetical protein